MDPPDGLQKLVDMSIMIDNRLFERRIEKRGMYSKQGRGGGWKGQRRDYGDPMDIDAMGSDRPSRLSGPHRSYGGNNKEREKRRRDNLCFNCGNPDIELKNTITKLKDCT